MPIYDYRCNECDALYDILHKGKEILEDVKCPKCGSIKFKKLFSLPSIKTNLTHQTQCSPSDCSYSHTCKGHSCCSS